jgi:hypothetical protein
MTDFLQKPGTNGFLTTPFNLLTTELNALANNASAVSSVGGTSGVFSQTNWASGIWGISHFKAGGAFTPTVGGYLAVWFLYSPDGGTTFEKVVSGTDLPRSPDIMIPLYVSAHATNDLVQASGILRLAWWSHKIFVVNHSGVSLPATGNIIQGASVAVAY